jgi:hypothetical protein
MRNGVWDGQMSRQTEEPGSLSTLLDELCLKKMRVNLKVPYSQKHHAKKLGARWDAALKTWYVEDVEHIGRFLQWVPDHLRKPHQARAR